MLVTGLLYHNVKAAGNVGWYGWYVDTKVCRRLWTERTCTTAHCGLVLYAGEHESLGELGAREHSIQYGRNDA